MHRPGAVLATLLTTLALTSTAAADSFCVAPAAGCDHAPASLQNALSSAGSLPGDDVIRLGAATYAEDNLVYSPGDHARVAIVGAGSSSTVIQPASATAGAYTLQATLGPIDISDVHLVAGGAAGTIALVLNAGGTVTYTDVTAAPGANGPSGINAATPAAIGAVDVTLPGTGTCVLGSGPGTFQVNDSTLSDCAKAVEAYAHRTVAQRLRLLNVVSGLHVIGDGVSAIFDDSLFVGRNNGTAATVEQTITSGGANTLQLDQDTFIGSGVGTGASASNAVNGFNVKLRVYDSIIRNFGTPIACASSGSDPADVDGDFVNYTGAPSDTCTGDVSLTNISASDPQFVNQGDGDYHLKPTSPLVDVDPTPIDTANGESDRDLESTVRIINGKRDLGAFERPLAPTATTGLSYGITDTSAFVRVTANGGGAHTQARLVYGPTSAYGSEIPLEMTQADFADRVYDVYLSGLAQGTTYHYALVATNPAGTVTSSDQTFTTTSPPPPACCAPPAAKAALNALRISPARFRAAARGATFAKTRTGATVTYTMSAAGNVRLRVLRCATKSRTCTRYVAVGKAISRTSAAGANRVRFSGRIRGKKLRPGRYRLQSLDPAGATQRAAFRIVRR